jgi:hypothetical protein
MNPSCIRCGKTIHEDQGQSRLCDRCHADEAKPAKTGKPLSPGPWRKVKDKQRFAKPNGKRGRAS